MRIIEQPGRLEIVHRFPRIRRAGLAVAALVPLLAPYELLIKPAWTNLVSPFFLAAALLSLGALAVSAFVLGAAAAALDQSLLFDATAGRLEYTSGAPAARRRQVVWPLSRVAAVDIRSHAWSEGETRYAIRVTDAEGRSLESGWLPRREQAEAAQARIRALLREACVKEHSDPIIASSEAESSA